MKPEGTADTDGDTERDTDLLVLAVDDRDVVTDAVTDGVTEREREPVAEPEPDDVNVAVRVSVDVAVLVAVNVPVAVVVWLPVPPGVCDFERVCVDVCVTVTAGETVGTAVPSDDPVVDGVCTAGVGVVDGVTTCVPVVDKVTGADAVCDEVSAAVKDADRVSAGVMVSDIETTGEIDGTAVAGIEPEEDRVTALDAVPVRDCVAVAAKLVDGAMVRVGDVVPTTVADFEAVLASDADAVTVSESVTPAGETEGEEFNVGVFVADTVAADVEERVARGVAVAGCVLVAVCDFVPGSVNEAVGDASTEPVLDGVTTDDGVSVTAADTDAVRVAALLMLAVADRVSVTADVTDGEKVVDTEYVGDGVTTAVAVAVCDCVAVYEAVNDCVRVPVPVNVYVCELVCVCEGEPTADGLAVPTCDGDAVGACEPVCVEVPVRDLVPVCVGVPVWLAVRVCEGLARTEGVIEAVEVRLAVTAAVPLCVPVPLGVPDAAAVRVPVRDRVCVSVEELDTVTPERVGDAVGTREGVDDAEIETATQAPADESAQEPTPAVPPGATLAQELQLELPPFGQLLPPEHT